MKEIEQAAYDAAREVLSKDKGRAFSVVTALIASNQRAAALAHKEFLEIGTDFNVAVWEGYRRAVDEEVARFLPVTA